MQLSLPEPHVPADTTKNVNEVLLSKAKYSNAEQCLFIFLLFLFNREHRVYRLHRPRIMGLSENATDFH